MSKRYSVRIQSVLYHNNMATVSRALESLANAARIALGPEGLASKVSVYYGDASETPVLCPSEIEELTERWKEYIDFHYVFFNENTGHGRGQNLLAQQSSAAYLLFLNPDIIVSQHLLNRLIDPFAAVDETVGITEGRQIPMEHSKWYDSKTGETSFATGACMMVDREIFERVSGFDSENFFMHCDDVDLSWRVRMLGYKVLYVPSAPVFHARRFSVGNGYVPPKTERLYSAEGGLMMAYKWSYPEVVDQHLNYFLSCPTGSLEYDAAQKFITRREMGALPTPLDVNHTVAQISSKGYGAYRY